MRGDDLADSGHWCPRASLYGKLLEAYQWSVTPDLLPLYWGAAGLSISVRRSEDIGQDSEMTGLWKRMRVGEELRRAWDKWRTPPTERNSTEIVRLSIIAQLASKLDSAQAPWTSLKYDGLSPEEAALVLALVAHRVAVDRGVGSDPAESYRSCHATAPAPKRQGLCLQATWLARLAPALHLSDRERQVLYANLQGACATGWLSLGCPLPGEFGPTLWLGPKGILAFPREKRAEGLAEETDWKAVAQEQDPRLLPSLEETLAAEAMSDHVVRDEFGPTVEQAQPALAYAMPSALPGPEERLRSFFERVVLPPEARETLTEALEVYDPGQSPPPTFLFHGPPGTGKTHAASLLASAIARPLDTVLIASILGHLVGSTEKALAMAFEDAAARGTLLFLDEADAFLNRRSPTDRLWEVTHVNSVLQALDQRRCPVVFATNRADMLDDAVRRRITWMVEFPLPGREERLALWRMELVSAGLTVPEPAVESLADVALSGGLIANAVRRVKASCDARRARGKDLAALLSRAACDETSKMGPRPVGIRTIGFRGRG